MLFAVFSAGGVPRVWKLSMATAAATAGVLRLGLVVPASLLKWSFSRGACGLAVFTAIIAAEPVRRRCGD